MDHPDLLLAVSWVYVLEERGISSPQALGLLSISL